MGAIKAAPVNSTLTFDSISLATGGDKPEEVDGFSVTWATDMDMEPEWRCLMRPLLVQGVVDVEEAELSIESKAILEEKRELVAVHERLVVEAEQRK